jgi:STE24 endopeptidase
MNALSVAFVIALGVAAGTDIWLSLRQLRYVRAHRDAVPGDFSSRVTLDQHRKAADYTSAMARFEIAAILYQSALLLAWTLGGVLNFIDVQWRQLGLGSIATGILVILSVLTVNAVLHLPFSIYRTFVIEQRFGFNHTRPALFASDYLKSGVLTLLIGVPAIAIVLWLMTPAGVPMDPANQVRAGWWLYAWLAWVACSMLMTWAYPAVIAPLFNRFVPLADAALEDRIAKLLARAGFSSKGVFVVDGSRRSAHGNAYFAGLGANKRIVFFDTLLDKLSPDEIEAVLAHELGHFKLRHVHKRIAVSALIGLCALALLDWLIGRSWFYGGLGVETASNYMALLLFAFAAPPFAFFLTPLAMALSRRHEYEADDFAAHQADAANLISALVKLYRDNATTLTPDPIYSAFHHSHPQALARIAHLCTHLVPKPS